MDEPTLGLPCSQLLGVGRDRDVQLVWIVLTGATQSTVSYR
ncbi:MAG: hypothetical protein AAF773_25950 [Cyanobacteria bacterium P01_D01_bin.115]